MTGLELEVDLVQRRRAATQLGQHGVNLTAVMGLVVEEVEQCRAKRLLPDSS